ncbi:MAG: sensor histidine kinase [Paenibacillus lautus]|uniref:sensor histidine kinase n=1 Tax=Paenibacillus lautus TaxID=1401 RepID=UPI0026F2D7D4|nr:sensor histidine kinase [Paenibacillus lautus]MCI1777935.1 sensor histidine kinase [Paenibacillus lautus]
MRSSLGWIGNYGLKQKALVIFLFFVILPTLGVGVLAQDKLNEVLRGQFIQSSQRSLEIVTNQLEEQTAMIEDIADYLILSNDMRQYLRLDPPPERGRAEQLKQNLEGFLTFQLMSKNYIKSISITGFNGNSIEMGEPIHGNEEYWNRLADEHKGGIVWSNGYPSTSGWYGEANLVSLFRVLNSYDEITLPLARLVIRMDEASILKQLQRGLTRDEGMVFIVDAEGHIVLPSKELLSLDIGDGKAITDNISSGTMGTSTYRHNGEAYLTFHQRMENTDWTIVSMVPKAALDQDVRGVSILMQVILIGILLLGLLALIGFHYTIIRPILRLKIETNRVKLGDFNARVPIRSKDEISELNRRFNDMVSTIQELIEHKYKLELRERESELRLLQEQMDPHFLYNTLDMIRWTARLEKAVESSQLIEILSRFLRSSLNNGHYETSLAKEMEFVRSYLYLQQRRLGSKLKYALYMEYDLANSLTLKATIQPLVENFLKHGLDRREPIARITVIAYKREDEIWIDVQDNGRGMDDSTLEEVRESLRIGVQAGRTRGALSNIHERLYLFFGERYGLEVIEASSQGTLIRLKLPYSETYGGESYDATREDSKNADR